MKGDRQELPVARIHARGAGQKLAQAGFAASASVARAGRAVGRGSVVLAKAIAVIALPAMFIGMIGSTARHHREPPNIKIPTHNVRFDDAYLKSLMKTDWSKLTYTPVPMPMFTLDTIMPSGPRHEPLHPTW